MPGLDPLSDLAGQTPEQADEVDRLKRELALVSRQLYEVKHKHADYLEAVTSAVESSISQIHLAPVKPPKLKAVGPGKPEVAVAMLSDMQTGKITPDYNSDVAAERVALYAQKVIKIAAVQEMHHPVRHCVVPILGDTVEGVDIFPGQQWLIDSTLYAQVFKSTPTIIAEFLRTLLTYFDTVTVEAVDGNHGHIGRKGMFGPEDNADKMVYRVVELMLRDEPRVTFRIADPAGERAWYKLMEIGNYKALLIHGDQIRGHSGFPWYGLGKKVNGWGSGALGVDSDFNDVFMGHWHQLAKIPLNRRSVYVNGSTESYNTFAQEMLAAQSSPSQWLLFVDPEAGVVTGSYEVRLDGPG